MGITVRGKKDGHQKIEIYHHKALFTQNTVQCVGSLSECVYVGGGVGRGAVRGTYQTYYTHKSFYYCIKHISKCHCVQVGILWFHFSLLMYSSL